MPVPLPLPLPIPIPLPLPLILTLAIALASTLAWLQTFDEVDSNHDGVIDRGELDAAMQVRLP